MHIWHKLSKRHIDFDRDAVVTIYQTSKGVKAGYRLPFEPTQLIDREVEEVLSLTDNPLRLANCEVIILDEDDLWNDKWGQLVDHPTRGTKLQSKPSL